MCFWERAVMKALLIVLNNYLELGSHTHKSIENKNVQWESTHTHHLVCLAKLK